MKNKIRILGIIALVAVIAFTFAVCSGDKGPSVLTYRGTSSGENYTLKITENTGRYTPKGGDTYVLETSSKRSTGTVSSASGSSIVLKPNNSDETFTVSVDGSSGITGFTGSLKWDGEDTPVSLPTTVTPTPPSGGGNSSGSSSAYLGQTLTLTGQVWRYNSDNGTWTEYTENRVIQSDCGGSGAITNGQLNFTIGTPSSSELESINFFNDEDYTNISISNSNAKCAVLSLTLEKLANEPAMVSVYIDKMWEDNDESLMAFYLYVDRDVTITGKGIKNYGNDGVYSLTTTDINLSFKAGWNVVCQNYNVNNNELIRSMSIKNPSNLRWVLYYM